MSNKVGRNEPCPCGSGHKFKKCCGALGAVVDAGGVPHTQAERAAAFHKLESFIDKDWEDAEGEAFDDFWGRHVDREDELPPDLLAQSRDVEEMWFAFDCELDDGGRIVDHFLALEPYLSPGERSFLLALRQSTMRLYEVTDTVPGSTMTLRDLVEGTVVTVAERTASRSIPRRECLAARVISRGCSGRPEMERGVLHIPGLWRDQLVAQVTQHRDDFLRDHPGRSVADFYKQLPPLIHDAWVSGLFEPVLPRLANTDGEEMVWTSVSFHVDDAGELIGALDAAAGAGIERAGDGRWRWSGRSASNAQVPLASLELHGAVLTVEASSVERGARARELVERIAGPSIRHRATSHEDVARRVKEAVSARALGRDDPSSEPPDQGLDPHVAEALVLDHYARHYRAWVDEPVPALDDHTPREAATIPGLTPRLEDLIHGLEGQYERALKAGHPAYDPSWMWAELELDEGAEASHPPPLAHERVAELVPGSGEVSRDAAERYRGLASFDESSTTVDERELARDLTLQRFLRRDARSAGDAAEATEETDERAVGAMAAPYLPLMVNLDLHRRKIFWVDTALSYMLEQTDLDVPGGDLRAPFPSFAVVFTDRHALSLGERLLSGRSDDPLRGQILRVATAYVTEKQPGDARILSVVFALDALGSDLPSLVRHDVPAGDEVSLRAYLEGLAPRPLTEPEVRDPSPARALVRLVLNAILYATSAGVSPELRPPPPLPRRARVPTRVRSSDSVFFLPGKIDIRRVHKLQELSRAPGGRAVLARFMVRGHWRRAAKSWTDQRLRWIEPHWKGPDMGAIIEKQYRLKP